MGRNMHAVLLPWSAFGHIMPFFQLSVALAKAGVHVSFISTPKIIQRLPKPPSNLAASIDLIELPLPVSDNGLLPEGAEATVDIPFEKIHHLKNAYDLLRHPFKQIVQLQSPDCIIIDVIPYWAVEVAKECHVPLIFFSVFSAASQAFLGPPEYLVGEGQKRVRPSPESMMSSPEWIDFPSPIAYRKSEVIPNYYGLFGPNGTEKTDAERVAIVLDGCQVVAVRTCPEYDGEYLTLLKKLFGKPVIPVGLLPPEKPKGVEGEIRDVSSWGKTFQWLNQQKPKSVVFVGFGSEYKLSKEEVFELAYGVEQSEVPFLWALRKPNWAVDETDALPSGFIERTSEKGIICMGWAPQMEILGHPAIGGSLFHAGWGSVIETLQFGHSLVVLPFIIDQALNARLVVEKGWGVEIEKNEDGSFRRDDIAKCLKLAMVSEAGEKLRALATQAGLVFGDRELQHSYITNFVQFLKTDLLHLH